MRTGEQSMWAFWLGNEEDSVFIRPTTFFDYRVYTSATDKLHEVILCGSIANRDYDRVESLLMDNLIEAYVPGFNLQDWVMSNLRHLVCSRWLDLNVEAFALLQLKRLPGCLDGTDTLEGTDF
jgi:hypothetical protein